MNLDELYNLVVKHFVKAPLGTYNVFDVEQPIFFEDESKIQRIDGDYTLNIILSKNANDKEKELYIKYVLDYTGQDLSNYIIDKKEKSFAKFGKNK